MVLIVVISTGPNREKVAQTPGEVIATVGVNSLPESQDNPSIHGQEMKVASDA